MKRVFSTVAALGLVAGMATAANALDFSVTGYYWAAGFYQSDAQGGGFVLNDGDIDVTGLAAANSTGETTGSDAYYAHELGVRPKLVVNDKVSISGDIRFIDTTVWGSQDDLVTNNGTDFDVNKLYMDYNSPIGMVRVGRAPGGAWGHDFLNTTGNADRLIWWPSFVPEPWGVITLIQKITDNDGLTGATPAEDDADSDLYLVGLTYSTAPIKFQLGYFLFDNATNVAVDRNFSRIDGSANFIFGNYYLDTELVYDFGDWQDFDAAGVDDVDVDAMGFMADVGANFGPLRTGLMYIYASGNDPGDDDMESIMTSTGGATFGAVNRGLGKDFQPYYILTGATSGVGVGDVVGARLDMIAAGMHSLGVYGDYQFNDRLSFHGAIVAAWADEADATFTGMTTGTAVLADGDNDTVADDLTGDLESRDDDYGWEVDLGAAYKLMDNLTYSVHFGYLAAGDYFAVQESGALVAGSTVLLQTEDANDVYQLIHKITLTF